MSITIVADENIARANDSLSQFGEVRLKAGREIRREDLLDADALVVRSITQVNADLLAGTPVRFVGTATIGTDHIDFDYLKEHDIAFADAAGGGARSVSEYTVAALLELRRRGRLRIEGNRLGVVGVGAIGSLLAGFGRRLGMEVLEHDPPRQESEAGFTSVPLQDIFACDAIALAVPLTTDGAHPTRHLVDDGFFRQMRPGTALINVSRGGVVDTEAFGRACRSGILGGAVLDVWEAEPEVPDVLFSCTDILTPHIAGYSRDGKLRGTEMMAEGIAAFLSCDNTWHVEEALPREAGVLDVSGLPALEAAAGMVTEAYDIRRDDAELRSVADASMPDRRNHFDRLRKTYRERREFPAWRFTTDDGSAADMLEGLGFVRK